MQNGFLTIPHALLSAAFRELTGGEFKLYLWLFRKIRGWHRDEGSFGRRQIAKELGIDSKTIQRNRDQLIRKGGDRLSARLGESAGYVSHPGRVRHGGKTDIRFDKASETRN